MSSVTLKRTAVTLGVLAGLLAATAPANAQIAPGPGGVTAAGGRPDSQLNDAHSSTKKPVAPTATFGGGLAREN